MWVVARVDKMDDLLKEYRDPDLEGEDWDLSVKAGSRYPVAGMAITRGVLHYAVRSDCGCFHHVPAAAFEANEWPMPDHWTFWANPLMYTTHVNDLRIEGNYTAAWGHPEYVLEPHIIDSSEVPRRLLEILEKEVESPSEGFGDRLAPFR